jgi:hypothetical protein
MIKVNLRFLRVLREEVIRRLNGEIAWSER